MDLQIHQIDTFRDWNPPNTRNLVIAVSFGLLFPARVLRAAKYGGLNIHPSLLPDLRGPAPLHHAILKRRKITGVSLQTMHPTKFDHGDVLAQGPMHGVPISDTSTPQQLLEILGPLGAEMLTDAIEKGTFVPPVRNILQGRPEPEDLAHAPKITPEDRHIDWNTWGPDEIKLRDRVLGRLWDTTTHAGSRILNHDDKRYLDLEGPRTVFAGPWRTESYTTRTKVDLIAPAPLPDTFDPRKLFEKQDRASRAYDEDEDYRGHYEDPNQPIGLLNPDCTAGVPFAFRNVEAPGGKEVRIGTHTGVLVVPQAVTVEGGDKGQGAPTLVAMLEEAQRRFVERREREHKDGLIMCLGGDGGAAG